ncbi:extracellular solute-binding protein [Cohnella endophytica]|uniref:Extracellular solute-binding protein n=1 Tax=Cohnella endophytica TaxID=2419778 RepID=A0A494XL64_9BACL|nr:extracellular solute-binding protein [Cohnella endophytica]RKP51358.1 extracellular solute-binding protein [Cohnella endophytica]
MKRMKAIFSVIMIAALLTGCLDRKDKTPSGASKNDDLTGTITIWSYATDNEAKINKAFNQLYPGIKVEVIPVPWADYDRKFQIALATGADLPDIVTVESYWWGKWQQKKSVFEDLSLYGIQAADINEMSSELIRGPDGELAFVPVATGIACIWYRKDLAQKYYGFGDSNSLEKKLTSWDALLDLGRRIKEESQGKEFLFPDTMSVEEFLIASHKDYMDGNALLLTDRILPQFELIQKMLEQGYIAKYKGMDLDRSYVQGNVMFYPFADWRSDYIKSVDRNGTGKWGVMKPPGEVFVRGGYGYAIPKKSNQANKKLAAKRIEFVLSQQGSQAVIMDTNQFSAYRNAFTDTILRTTDPYFKENIQQKIFDWSKEIRKPVRYGEYDDIIEMELRIQAYNMMMSSITAKQAIDNARKEIESKLKGKILIK